MREIDLADISDEQLVFWSLGNRPTQNLDGLDAATVLLHLKAVYLLCNKLLAAASYYFESPATRMVTDAAKLLFERGEVLYFVDESIEDYMEHGIRKAEKSPDSLTVYRNADEVVDHANTLSSLGYILRRPAQSISDRIVELWIVDVLSSSAGSLGEQLIRLGMQQERRAAVVNQLIEFARRRNKDFVWEYVEPQLRLLSLPKRFTGVARRRLSQMYAAATAELLHIPLDRTESGLSGPYITSPSRFDSSLFLSCMEALGVVHYLRDLSPSDLVVLKYSQEFQFFKHFYWSLIEVAAYRPEGVRSLLPLYRRSAQRYASGDIDRRSFIEGFQGLYRLISGRFRGCGRPLDYLIRAYDTLGLLSIEEFVNLLVRGTASTVVREGESRRASARLSGREPQGEMERTAMRKAEHTEGEIMTVAVIAALREELEVVVERAGKGMWKAPTSEDTAAWKIGTLDHGVRVVTAYASGMGLTECAIVTTRTILEYRPRLVAMVGICGGILNRGLGIGDLVVAEKAFHYQFGAFRSGKLEKELKSVDVDDKLLRRMRDFFSKRRIAGIRLGMPRGMSLPERELMVHFGPVASADLVVKEEEKQGEAKDAERKVIAIDMESYAFLRAAALLKVGAIVIKGVSDFANLSKGEQDTYREYAKAAVADAVWQFLAEEYIPGGSRVV